MQELLLSPKCRKAGKHPCVMDRHERCIDRYCYSQSSEAVVWNRTNAASHGSPSVVVIRCGFQLFRMSDDQPFFNTAVWNQPYQSCDYEDRLSEPRCTECGEER